MEATITLKLPCKLTKQEMKENDKALKEALLYLHSLEDRLDCELDEVKYTKRTLKEQRAKTTALQLKWENGEEERDVECEIRYNTPKPGQKIMIRKDTHKQVGGFSLMTDDEKNDIFNQTEKRVKVVLAADKQYPNLVTVSFQPKNDIEAFITVSGYTAAIDLILDYLEQGNITPDEVDWHDEIEKFKTIDEAIKYYNQYQEEMVNA